MNRAEIRAAVRLMQDAGHDCTPLPNDVILRIIGRKEARETVLPGYHRSCSLEASEAVSLEASPPPLPSPAEAIAPFGQYVPKRDRRRR